MGGSIGYCLRSSSISIRSASFDERAQREGVLLGKEIVTVSVGPCDAPLLSTRFSPGDVAELRRLQVLDIDRVVLVLLWRSFFSPPVKTVAVLSHPATRPYSHARTVSFFCLLRCAHVFWNRSYADLVNKAVIWLAYPITDPPSHRRYFPWGKYRLRTQAQKTT